MLAEALASVQAQTFADWECLVVDDGSTDASPTVAEAFARTDSRFRALKRHGDKRGANVCRNQGIEAAKGDYILLLDSDDLLKPECLEHRVRALEENPDLDFGVFAGEIFRFVPGDVGLIYSRPTSEHDIDRFLKLENPWITLHPLWTRGAIEKVGAWDERLPSWQDWEYHIRAISAGLSYKHFSYSDSYYRLANPYRQSITTELATTVPHLRSREYLLEKTANILIQAQLFNEKRRIYLVQRYLFLIEEWNTLGFCNDAMRVWAICRRTGLISQRQFVEGNMFLTLIRLTPTQQLRRVPRKLLRMWGAQYGFVHVIYHNSHGIPVDRADRSSTG